MMDTVITETAPDVHRLPTFVDEANLTMNQFLLCGDLFTAVLEGIRPKA